MSEKKRTACDVYKDAIKAYIKPSNLSKEEVDNLADTLFEMVGELHGMCERMEARLFEYNDYATNVRELTIQLLRE